MAINGRCVYKMKHKTRMSSDVNRDTSGDWRSCKSKVRYRSDGEANQARTRINKKRDTPLEIYYCNRCGGYHLTRSIEYKIREDFNNV